MLEYPTHILERLAESYSGVSLAEAHAIAYDADDAYGRAVEGMGYSSRWTIPHRVAVLLPEYAAKISADRQMHLAFEANRARAKEASRG